MRGVRVLQLALSAILPALFVSGCVCVPDRFRSCGDPQSPFDPFRSMPQFPWPPPEWTSRYALPVAILSGGPAPRLGEVFDRLEAALRRAKIDEWSVYAIGDDGFAVAARMESIRDDGVPVDGGNRWTIRSRVEPPQFDLLWYVRGLMTAQTGRYRIIAVVITPRVVTAGTPERGELIRKLPYVGPGRLPPELRNRSAPSSCCAEALIYEFYRASADDSPRSLKATESRLTARGHLIGAGLLPLVEQ
jgi:hypothetical protein